ncbi:MAG: PKD domain-containing protein [Acidobacteriota bacterium]
MPRQRAVLGMAALLLGGIQTLRAATYLPLSDADLARRSPVIVRARVVSSGLSREVSPDGEAALSTRTTLRTLEVLKGDALEEGNTFSVVLPGGIDGDRAVWVPGTPVFAGRGEVLLFLAPRQGGSAEFGLTEFGLSKFDILYDRSGRSFAARPVFTDDEDDAVSRRIPGIRPLDVSGRRLRDAASFLSSVRAASAGLPDRITAYGSPVGDVGPDPVHPGVASPMWVNIGGVEGAGALFRWYWDTGLSPHALVTATGEQTGLSDGSNGLSSVENAVTQWSAVPGTNVRYSQSSGTAPVVVHLDVENEAPAWSEPLSCTSGGIIGYGGPGTSRSAPAYLGASGYYAPASGAVWMRKVTGGCYSAATFRSAVLHELGHTLGLGHSDQDVSAHSTSTAAERDDAVMRSVIPSSRPSTPQADDVQAIRYYYGAGSTPVPAPSARFFFSPATPLAGQVVTFTDGSTGSPSSWSWTFGDGSSSTAQSPAKSYAAAGSYTVTLVAGNVGGSSSTTRTVTVGPGAATVAPVAAFDYSPANPTPGSAVSFTDVSSGTASSWSWTFGDPASGSSNVSSLAKPTHHFLSPGTYTVKLTVSNSGGSSSMTRAVTVSSCGGGQTVLCLNGGRFRVEADWRVPSQGTSGKGTAVPLTGDTGFFWFFTNNNVELVVKVVDGRAFNGKFWFFSGALSDVEYTIRVTDTTTGAVRTYFNPQGTLASTSDTSAFDSGGGTAVASPSPAASADSGGAAHPTRADPAASPCGASDTRMCLNGSRFRVEVAWRVPDQNTSGEATAVPVTGDTGYFWFFSANNVELVVKVVDGRAFNGRYWVFAGGLSDVGYTITVTDTATGLVRVYENPAGALHSFSDSAAF